MVLNFIWIGFFLIGFAVALARLGAKVGLLDADITGPNIPTMLGIEQGALAEGDGGLRTIEAHGVRAISLGFVLPKGTPVVWRGPMIHGALQQLFTEVVWGELDYLIVDAAAGIAPSVLAFMEACQRRFIVVKDEPSSIADAYGIIKVMTRDLELDEIYLIPNMVESQAAGAQRQPARCNVPISGARFSRTSGGQPATSSSSAWAIGCNRAADSSAV